MKRDERPPRGPGQGHGPGQGRPPYPRRGGDARRPDPLAQKAADIAKSTGLSLEAARQVAAGRADLNELLKRMAFRDEVNSLIQRHDLNRALATQVALGQVSLEQVLMRRRVEVHLDANRDRSVLDAARESGKPLTLGLHGHKNLQCTIVSVGRYDLQVKDLEGGEEHTVHKLQVKYAYEPDDHKKVRKGLEYDKARRDLAVEPIVRPQDRFACSDKRLGVALDQKRIVTAVTLEGECFTGEIVWIARYEFGLRTRHGGEVVIFRHALDDLREQRPG